MHIQQIEPLAISSSTEEYDEESLISYGIRTCMNMPFNYSNGCDHVSTSSVAPGQTSTEAVREDYVSESDSCRIQQLIIDDDCDTEVE